MKIKNILVLLLSLTLFFTLLSGCSNNNNTQSSQNGNPSGNFRGNFKLPGLTGQVSNIKGNDFTLNLIATPQMGGTRSRRSYQSGGNGGQYQSGQSRPQRTINFTGEVRDYVIPSGTKLVTTSFSQGVVSQSTVTVDSIKIDDTLSVYYAADGKTIDYISVSNSSSGGGFGGGFGGGYGGGNGGGSN